MSDILMSCPIDKLLIECVLEVHQHFQDAEKTAKWFNTENPMFGNIRPVTLFRVGRGHKVKQFIANALAGDLP